MAARAATTRSPGGAQRRVRCARNAREASLFLDDFQYLYLSLGKLSWRMMLPPGGEGRPRPACHTDLSEALAKHTGHATVQPDFSHLLYFFSDPPSSSSSVVSVAFFFA